VTYAPAAEPEFAAWWLDRQQASPADLELLGTPSLGWDQLRPGWPVDSVRDARITVIGVGSIGSAAVHGLATYGVGRIALADPERLLAHNLIRHQLSARHLGLMKVDALAEQIHSSWANTVIGPLALDASADADRMRPLFDVSAAVVCAADGVRPRRVVSHLARRSGTPAVLACILEEGEIGEIIRLMPWPTKGCLLCHRQHLADSGRFDPEPTLDLPYGQGTGPRPMTAVAGDLQLVGQLAAKVAVATLLEGNGYYDQVLSADHLVVGLRPRPGLPPPADVRRAAELRWSVIGSPRPGCPSCHPATADEATSGPVRRPPDELDRARTTQEPGSTAV
jgi:molybdopterin-synthase adenylyltransferase